jgi:hypothetical protein
MFDKIAPMLGIGPSYRPTQTSQNSSVNTATYPAPQTAGASPELVSSVQDVYASSCQDSVVLDLPFVSLKKQGGVSEAQLKRSRQLTWGLIRSDFTDGVVVGVAAVHSALGCACIVGLMAGKGKCFKIGTALSLAPVAHVGFAGWGHYSRLAFASCAENYRSLR